MTAQQPPDSVLDELADVLRVVGAGQAYVVVRRGRPSCQQCPKPMVP